MSQEIFINYFDFPEIAQERCCSVCEGKSNNVMSKVKSHFFSKDISVHEIRKELMSLSLGEVQNESLDFWVNFTVTMKL